MNNYCEYIRKNSTFGSRVEMALSEMLELNFFIHLR